MRTDTIAQTWGRTAFAPEGAADGGRFPQQGPAGRDDPLGAPEASLSSSTLHREITERLLLAALHAQDVSAAARDASSATLAFLGRVSHELRGLVNVISGYVDLLDMGVHGPLSARQRVDLDSIQQAEQQLLVLLDDLLSFLKIREGQPTYRPADVPVHDILTQALTLMKPTMQGKGLSHQGPDCDPDFTVRADPDRLRQILFNLLSNAAKFTASGGRVGLGCEAAGDVVQIRVSDSGVGIPSDRLQDIFDPFVQLGATRADSKRGVGLGLAISRDLARGMGGDLTVESAVGVGSTFTLTLPRH